LGDWISLVWLTPAQDRLFTESAGARRRFLDRLVLALHPAHARDASRYEAAMRQRNRLLSGGPHDKDWLAALESAMVAHGHALAARRSEVVESLGGWINDEPAGPFARAALRLEGFDASRDFDQDLATGRSRDAAAGRTLSGPHRQDLVVAHLDKGIAAASCSTGEQKALLIGIVLAHADLVTNVQGRRPVLLLDEVAAHLDPARRAALLERLILRGGQAWMTGTERGPFDAAGSLASWLSVEHGKITEC
jgi:DNA replication and repair protein RecF